MQTSLKFFELIPLGSNTGANAQKIAIRVNSNGEPLQDHASSSFFECLNALVSLPDDQMKASLEQLEWIPVDEQGGFLAPIIDFAGNDGMATVALDNELQYRLTGREGSLSDRPQSYNLSRSIASFASMIKSDEGEMDGTFKMFQGKWALKPIRLSEGEEVPIKPVHIETAKSGVASKIQANHDHLWEETSAKGTNQQADMDQSRPMEQDGVIKNLRGLKGGSIPQNFADQPDKMTAKPSTDDVDAIKAPPGKFSDLSSKSVREIANTIPDNESETTHNKAAMEGKTSPLISGAKQRTLTTLLSAEKNTENYQDKFVNANTGNEKSSTDNANRQAITSDPTHRQRQSFQAMEPEAPMLTRTPDREEFTARYRTAGFKGGSAEEPSPQFIQENTTSSGGNQEQQGNASRENQPILAGRISSSPSETSQIAHTKETSEPQPAFRSMQDDVMRQIVQRMTLKNEGAQSKMSIQLKPEFLGNLKLQISTENQQVVVRMTAESTAVKEMIETNLSVLRNELQQHGLQIDKFDVFVGQEDPTWKQRQQHTALRQRRQGGFGKIKDKEDETSDEELTMESIHAGTDTAGRNSMNEIDFFA